MHLMDKIDSVSGLVFTSLVFEGCHRFCGAGLTKCHGPPLFGAVCPLLLITKINREGSPAVVTARVNFSNDDPISEKKAFVCRSTQSLSAVEG